MASIDQKSVLKNLNALTPAAISSNTTTVGIEIDSIGFNSLTFLNRCSAFSDGVFTPLIEATDVSGSGYVTITGDSIIGTEAKAALSAAGDSKVGIAAIYRYYRISFVSTGVSTGATLDSVALLGSPRSAPVA